jgi:hypothetical protein
VIHASLARQLRVVDGGMISLEIMHPDTLVPQQLPLATAVRVTVHRSRAIYLDPATRGVAVPAAAVARCLARGLCGCPISSGETLPVVAVGPRDAARADEPSPPRLVATIDFIRVAGRSAAATATDAIVGPSTVFYPVAEREPHAWDIRSAEEIARAPTATAEIGSAAPCLIDETDVPADGDATRELIDVISSDGECFPCERALLRPCLALTASTRDRDCALVPIAVDCVVFSRVLDFLECHAGSNHSTAQHSDGGGAQAQTTWKVPHRHLAALLDAADALGCTPLRRVCEDVEGRWALQAQSRSAEEILALCFPPTNRDCDGGARVIVVVDRMCLDVTEWMPNHPGGSMIGEIAVGVDATVLFEVFHATREGFEFLRDLYIGELVGADLPHPAGYPPVSEVFLKTLRSFTDPWRNKIAAVRNL